MTDYMPDRRARKVIRDVMARILANPSTGKYAGDYPGDCADRIIRTLGGEGFVVTRAEPLGPEESGCS